MTLDDLSRLRELGRYFGVAHCARTTTFTRRVPTRTLRVPECHRCPFMISAPPLGLVGPMSGSAGIVRHCHRLPANDDIEGDRQTGDTYRCGKDDRGRRIAFERGD